MSNKIEIMTSKVLSVNILAEEWLVMIRNQIWLMIGFLYFNFNTFGQRMIKSFKLAVLLLVIVTVAQSTITQINAKNFQQKVQEAPYTLVYLYSSSCNFCKEFTPLYQKLQNHQKIKELAVALTKIDGPTYQELALSLEVYSYPSLLFYRKGVLLPIHFYRARKQQQIVDSILQVIKSSDRPDLLASALNLTAEQRVAYKASIFYGKRQSAQFWSWDIIARRHGFMGWSHVQSNQTKAVAGDIQISDFSDLPYIQSQLAKTFARLQEVNEESWLRMVEKKQFTIIYFNKHGSEKTKQLLAKIAKETPEANFINIDGTHEEYKSALRAVGIHDEENIVAVDKKYDVLYVAPEPYSEASLKEFISKAQRNELELYRKTEKTDKPNKLTRDNYQQRMSTNQDVLLFLYDKSEPISKELMKLFQFLLLKLKDNKNLLLLRCDVGLNEVEEKLGFVVKPTPKLVFLRNRMKDYPIHFGAKTISVQSVLEFIMENTTFDFEEQQVDL